MKKYVYVIYDGKYRKIGYTFDIEKRFSSLQCSNSIDLELELYVKIDEAQVLEAELHAKFSKHRVRGEWFDVSLKKIKKYLKKLGITYTTQKKVESQPSVIDFKPMVKKHIFDGFEIAMDDKTGFLRATDLVNQYNEKMLDCKLKSMSKYLSNDATKEFIEAVRRETDLVDVVIVKKGRGNAEGSGTWVHPYIFLDILMWLDVKLKVRVLAGVYDMLLHHNYDSGDSFKKANTALKEAHPEDMAKPFAYPRVANKVAEACGRSHLKGYEKRWNKCDEDTLKLRDEILNMIVVLADITDSPMSCVNLAIRKTYKKRKDLILKLGLDK